MRRYLVDNSRLGAETRGLQFRLSKRPDDRDGSAAVWGSTVEGREEGGGWLRVGDRYLPMEVDGVPVLTTPRQAVVAYDGHWLRDSDGLHVGQIEGGLLRWSSDALSAAGQRAEVAYTKVAVADSGDLTMDLQGQHHVGRLADGKLAWSDGEVWRRAEVGKLPELGGVLAQVHRDAYEVWWLQGSPRSGEPRWRPCSSEHWMANVHGGDPSCLCKSSEGTKAGMLILPSGLIRRIM